MKINRCVVVAIAVAVFAVQNLEQCSADEPSSAPTKGVIKLPKNVPGWTSGKVKNLPDIEYDVATSGGSGSNGSPNGGSGPGSNGPGGGSGSGGNNGGGSGGNGGSSGSEANGNGGTGGTGGGSPGSVGSGPGGSGNGSSGGGSAGSGDSMAGNVTKESLKNLSAWKELLSFRPPVNVQRSVQAVGNSWTTHRVEDGQGDLNLDYYPLVIETLPTVAGKQLTAAELLDFVRKNINLFVDTDYCYFAPFKPADLRKWNSSDATGANILIDIKLLDNVIKATDLAMVVASRHTPNEWVFSTVQGGSSWMAINDRNKPGAHPVSGNRAFGFREGENGSFVFYIMGADRATLLVDRAGNRIGFYYADKLWRSYQQRVVDFVNGNGGSARVDTENTVADRHDWDEVKTDTTIYDPSNQPEWIRLPRNFE